MAKDLAALLTSMLEDPASEHGLELVAVEVTGAGGAQVVRVFLDREGGIDIDAIAGANEWISDLLEASDHLHAAYTLEVSSPGIERPLRKPADYERFAGREAVIKLVAPVERRGSLTGTLAGFADGAVLIDVDGTRMSVPLETIKKSHLKFDFASIEEGNTR